jgi:hypothetical protein
VTGSAATLISPDRSTRLVRRRTFAWASVLSPDRHYLNTASARRSAHAPARLPTPPAALAVLNDPPVTPKNERTHRKGSAGAEGDQGQHLCGQRLRAAAGWVRQPPLDAQRQAHSKSAMLRRDAYVAVEMRALGVVASARPRLDFF